MPPPEEDGFLLSSARSAAGAESVSCLSFEMGRGGNTSTTRTCEDGEELYTTHHLFRVRCAASYSAHATSSVPAARLTSTQALLSLWWADSI